MGFLSEVNVVDPRGTLNFFLDYLQKETRDRRYKDDEMAYVAKVLAHYACVSRCNTSTIPVMSCLGEVFEHCVFQPMGWHDPEILEIGASQILLFAGFFRDQTQQKHNVVWYDGIGQSFYDRVSHYSYERKKKDFFGRMSRSFPAWTIVCRDVSRRLRDDRYLLRVQ